MKYLYALLLLLSLPSFIQAQGSISGKIIDTETREPIPFVNIAIKGITNSKYLNGVLSDFNGEFTATDLPYGKHLVTISYIGYHTLVDSIEVSDSKKNYRWNRITLSPKTEQLQEFEIVAKKDDMMIAIDRKVFNISNNPILEGASAMDALRQIPTLVVDAEGNVSLRGSGNIMIFMNGRPSGITADNLQSVLEGLPANSIENIEVITNPSARFDADGNAGIINIITKKNVSIGSFGSVNAGVGTRNKYNLGGSYNFGGRKLKGMLNLNTQYQEFFRLGSTQRDNFFQDQPITNINTERVGLNGRTNVNLSGNLDYEINEQSALGLTFVAGYNNRWERDTVAYFFLEDFNNQTGTLYRENQGAQNNWNGDIGLNFTHNFGDPKSKKKNQLLLGQNVSYYIRDDQQDFWEQEQSIALGYIDQPFREAALRTRLNLISITQVDYLKDFENLSFETGAKLNIRDLRNGFEASIFNYDTEQFENNVNLTNRFDYLEYVSAAYINFNGKINSFGYQAGLRAEHSRIEIDQPETNQSFTREYIDWFPSAFVNKTFGEGYEIQLNYTRRINRPGPWALNPFPDLTDPFNIRTGNPFLEPEYVNSYEFSTVKKWDDHSLTISLFHRTTNDAIQRVTLVDEVTSIANNTRLNLGRSENTGIELIARNQIASWWSNTFNLNVFRNFIEGTGLENSLVTDAINWNFRVMSNFDLAKGYKIQLTGFYLAPVNTPQGRWVGYYHVDLGIRKDILKGKGTLVLNIMDVFDIREYAIEFDDFNFRSRGQYKWESQWAMLNFTYRIGKSGNRPQQEKEQRSSGGGNMDFGF
ncbi:MAG: TonB-dependent receptor domain-containing protein [Luteibaculaceae bacterium]